MVTIGSNGHSVTPPPRVVWRQPGEPAVMSTESLELVIGLLGTLEGATVTLDVEHSGYPIGHPDYVLRTVQLGNADLAVVLSAEGPDAWVSLAIARRTLDLAGTIVAHASQADVIPVALACGEPGLADAWFAKITDTAVLGALADPHLTGMDRGQALDLKGLSGRLLAESAAPAADKARGELFRRSKLLTNLTPTTPVERSGWAQVSYEDPIMARYAASDVLDTAALETVLSNALRGAPEGLVSRERAVLAQTARIARDGFPLDADWIREHAVYAINSRAARLLEIRKLGVEEPGSTAKLGARFAELGADLPRTPTGKPSTASEALEALAQHEGEAAELARAVLAWREQDKILGTYLSPYALLCKHGDGRVRPTVQTLGAAATGRMSVVRPNLQQLPQSGGVRGCIVADPGHRLIAADFSGVELRIAAALSHDESLSAMIAEADRGEGPDLHWRIARQVWGPDATKANRYAAKRVVFGKIYGAGVAALARQMGGHGEAVHEVIATMESLTPGLTQWSDRLRTEVRAGTRPAWHHPSGRLTYLPRDTPHKAPNYVIQSTGRELLVDALGRWEGAHPGCVLLPIHDEIVVHVPEDTAQAWTLDLVQAMTTELLGVPIVAEADEPMVRWADAT